MMKQQIVLAISWSMLLLSPLAIAAPQFDVIILKDKIGSTLDTPLTWQQQTTQWTASHQHAPSVRTYLNYSTQQLQHTTTITPEHGVKIAIVDCLNLAQRVISQSDEQQQALFQQYRTAIMTFMQDWYGAYSSKSELISQPIVIEIDGYQLKISGTGIPSNYTFKCVIKQR